jgi:hypothetical protein
MKRICCGWTRQIVAVQRSIASGPHRPDISIVIVGGITLVAVLRAQLTIKAHGLSHHRCLLHQSSPSTPTLVRSFPLSQFRFIRQPRSIVDLTRQRLMQLPTMRTNGTSPRLASFIRHLHTGAGEVVYLPIRTYCTGRQCIVHHRHRLMPSWPCHHLHTVLRGMTIMTSTSQQQRSLIISRQNPCHQCTQVH